MFFLLKDRKTERQKDRTAKIAFQLWILFLGTFSYKIFPFDQGGDENQRQESVWPHQLGSGQTSMHWKNIYIVLNIYLM